MKPFSHPDYNKNQKRAGRFTPCAHCGKGIKKPDSAQYARVLEGGNRFGSSVESNMESAGDGDMGWYPVGPECAKKLIKAGVFLQGA